MAALLAQAGRPFIVQHTLAKELSKETLSASPMAQEARWLALLSPDGVVGYYDRKKWQVVCSGGTASELRWEPLDAELMPSTLRPRHVTTPDCSLDDALSLWAGERPSWTGAPPVSLPYVYLRGSLRQDHVEELLHGTIFSELLGTGFFGSSLTTTLYLSQQGLQTNLHCDEHSGFLVQVAGLKRVVLVAKADAKPLRCATWGDPAAPISRRSWFDDGVPDCADWRSKPPLAGIRCSEVQLGPGEALFIPKGHFHDVLSKSEQTLGFVLRCS